MITRACVVTMLLMGVASSRTAFFRCAFNPALMCREDDMRGSKNSRQWTGMTSIALGLATVQDKF